MDKEQYGRGKHGRWKKGPKEIMAEVKKAEGTNGRGKNSRGKKWPRKEMAA